MFGQLHSQDNPSLHLMLRCNHKNWRRYEFRNELDELALRWSNSLNIENGGNIWEPIEIGRLENWKNHFPGVKFLEFLLVTYYDINHQKMFLLFVWFSKMCWSNRNNGVVGQLHGNFIDGMMQWWRWWVICYYDVIKQLININISFFIKTKQN